jgi:DnaJ-class molecular chaperone
MHIDPVEPNTPPPDLTSAGEDTCPKCEGQGRLADGSTCPECGGSGKVVQGIGGG